MCFCQKIIFTIKSISLWRIQTKYLVLQKNMLLLFCICNLLVQNRQVWTDIYCDWILCDKYNGDSMFRSISTIKLWAENCDALQECSRSNNFVLIIVDKRNTQKIIIFYLINYIIVELIKRREDVLLHKTAVCLLFDATSTYCWACPWPFHP